MKGDAGDFPLDEFNGFLARSKRRIDVLAGLASGDFAMCESAIAKLADSSRSYDETVAWLLTRLPRFDVREGDAEFLTNVKKIGTEKRQA